MSTGKHRFRGHQKRKPVLTLDTGVAWPWFQREGIFLLSKAVHYTNILKRYSETNTSNVSAYRRAET